MDLLRMSHDCVRMICKYGLKQLQAVILSESYRRKKFWLLSISQETNIVQDLREEIRRFVLGHVSNTYTIRIQCRAVYCRRAISNRNFSGGFMLMLSICVV